MTRGFKSFYHRSYKTNGEPDLDLKSNLRNVCKKYGIHLTQDKVTDNNGQYNRPDLIDEKRKFVVESDGSWHETQKGHNMTLRRINNYSELGLSCGIFDPNLFEYLLKCDNPYEFYMAPIIQTFNVNKQWGLIL